MARNRERVLLEDGPKLALNTLIRQGIMQSGTVACASISCGTRWSRNATESGVLVLVLTSASRGSMWLQFGALEQRIDLVAAPRHLGGAQWYFVCPELGRRASVLWMPPGANRFACRQAWGPWVAYRSQFVEWQYRALYRAQQIHDRLGGDMATSQFGDLPARPRFMRWRTYKAQLERLEAYKAKCDLYERH